MTASTIIPTMRCHDTRAMVDWLCRAFGFEEHLLATVDQDYGGRGYSCRNPEGNLWSFGSYDPWVLS